MTHLHRDLNDIFLKNATSIAVARPNKRDVSYKTFGEMIASVQSVLTKRSPRAAGIADLFGVLKYPQFALNVALFVRHGNFLHP